jgi:hypothetical protein
MRLRGGGAAKARLLFISGWAMFTQKTFDLGLLPWHARVLPVLRVLQGK